MSHALERIYRELNRECGLFVHETVKVIIFSRKQIWVWIPKNAGGSLCRNLLMTYGDCAVATTQPLKALYQINAALRDFEVLAFKRNPYTRAVSCWLNKIAVGDDAALLASYPNLIGASFSEFAAWLNTEAGRDEIADPHWRSQVDMLNGVHRLLRFEDLPHAVSELGLDPHAIQHRNTSKKMMRRAGLKYRPLLQWYDRASYEAISTRYARDLRELYYEFPAEPPATDEALIAAEKSEERHPVPEDAATMELQSTHPDGERALGAQITTEQPCEFEGRTEPAQS